MQDPFGLHNVYHATSSRLTHREHDRADSRVARSREVAPIWIYCLPGRQNFTSSRRAVVKVGSTFNLQQRLRQHQRHTIYIGSRSFFQTWPLGVMTRADGFAVERAIHAALGRHFIRSRRSEWYFGEPSEIAAIVSAVLPVFLLSDEGMVGLA